MITVSCSSLRPRRWWKHTQTFSSLGHRTHQGSMEGERYKAMVTLMAVGNWKSRETERGTGNGERGTGNGERGTGNGERGTGNGERGTGNGERGTGNGERGTGNGERGTGNGERGTGNGERGTGNGERGTGNGERGTGNGERGTGNGERGTGNGERGTGNGERGTGNLFWARPHAFLMSMLRPREGWGRGYYNTEPLQHWSCWYCSRGDVPIDTRSFIGHNSVSSIIHVLVVELRVLHVYLC